MTKESRESHPEKILMVGNIEKRKYKLAFRLFKKFEKAFPAEIHIYGNILDKRLARKLDSFGFVRLMGFKKSIPYWEYQCLLHTSMIENLPISICESLFHKIPVIAFDVGGISEVVNKSNGLLVKAFELNTMVLSINEIVKHDIKFSFSDNDLNEYDWKLASDRYAGIFSL
jgi:glycosyltransferase involved in cell wall biosynthesis